MTDLSDLCVRMADEVCDGVDVLRDARTHLHRPASGLSNDKMPLLAVYCRSVVTRFDTSEPESRATQTWHLDWYVSDVLAVEAAQGEDTARDAIDVGEQISRLVVGWGSGIPDGLGGVLEEYAEPRRLDVQEDGGVLRIRNIVEVSTLAWV